ncbi:MAG: S8 family peptidase [Acidobacteria bacterium]|nr:S8 family peptidase [Acidobacteriota bacterium]
MEILTHRELDPKLRRLVQRAGDPERLARSVRGGEFTAGMEDLPAGPLDAALLTKRVLVRLAGPEVPQEHRDLKWVRIVDDIFAVDVPLPRLAEVAASPAVEYVEAGRNMAPALSSSVPETRADVVRAAPLALTGKGVVVGVIDFGFDFTLDDFRNADGSTRIAFLWDQGLSPRSGESSPARFAYGVEYDRAAIDEALAGPGNPFGRIRHQPGPGTHGTHVAGTAAGNGRTGDAAFPAGVFVGVAPEAILILVQPDTRDAAGSFTDSVHVAEAIAYVFEKADELGLPCVINMSLGQNGGSHDGESVVERAIDRILERPGRAMVVAAGNEHTWRGHAGGTLTEGESRTLRWRFGGGLTLPSGGQLPPGFGDFTPNELEIWYSSRDVFRIRVRDPRGNVSPFVDPGNTEAHTFPGGDQAFIDSERFTVLNGDARIYIELSPGGQVLTEGTWEVEIEAVEVREGVFDAWIERDARRRENNFADQSFFVGADFDGRKTLGTPATTRRGIAVANYDHRLQAPSDSSSRGPTREGRGKPEVAAPGTNIFSSASLAGRPNPAMPVQLLPARIPMSGTSMASPHVAGIVALMLEKDSRLSTEQIRKILIASASPPPGVDPFDNAWGYGRVDAEAAVELVG